MCAHPTRVIVHVHPSERAHCITGAAVAFGWTKLDEPLPRPGVDVGVGVECSREMAPVPFSRALALAIFSCTGAEWTSAGLLAEGGVAFCRPAPRTTALLALPSACPPHMDPFACLPPHARPRLSPSLVPCPSSSCARLLLTRAPLPHARPSSRPVRSPVRGQTRVPYFPRCD